MIRKTSATCSALPLLVLLAAPLSAQYVYVANYDGSNISAFRIDPASGALTPVLGSPFQAGANPTSVTLDPTGKFAYVANSSGNNITGYTVNSDTGALTQMPGPTFPVSGPRSVAVDPTGKYAYSANYFSTTPTTAVAGFSINGLTGALTPFLDSPFPSGANPASLAIDRTGKYVYFPNAGSKTVTAYSINSLTGSLSQISNVSTDTGPLSIALHPTGPFAYVANGGSNNVWQYTVDAFTGALTAGPAVAAGTTPRAVAVEPGGRFAYVANDGSGTISGYTINAGALTPMPGLPFPAGTSPRAIAIDPTGRFLYVANHGSVFASGSVSAYTIDSASGLLAQIQGSPFAAGSGPEGILAVVVDTSTNVSVTAAGSPDVVRGDNLTYTFTVTNLGFVTATNVIFTDPLPTDTKFVSDVAPQAWNCVDPSTKGQRTGAVTCNTIGLAPGASATFVITVEVAHSLKDGDVISNIATVNSDTHDTNSANNVVTVSTTVSKK